MYHRAGIHYREPQPDTLFCALCAIDYVHDASVKMEIPLSLLCEENQDQDIAQNGKQY